MKNIFCPLASGSKGNCLYVATPTTKILIDVGISFKQVQERLNSIQVDIQEIDAILITHEHSDHIRGLETLCKKKNYPIFANADTAQGICAALPFIPKFKIFSTGESFTFGDIEIHPFSIQHDTLDPVAFRLTMGDKKLGVCADLGFVTTLVRAHLQDCDIVYIESNHEPSMVHASSRPMTYKQRVLGRQGHLSNEGCAQLLKDIYHQNLKKVYLAHLSEECNHPEVALKRSKESLQDKDVMITIAHQHKVSELTLF